ncbi:sperm acrosome membrane-associated protein 4-like [Lycodopsis pacificus]
MNKMILQLLAVGLCFAVVQSLECYECPVGLWNLCMTSKTTCPSGEVCYSGVGEAAGFLKIKRKGCMKVTECNKTENVNFPASSNTTIYTITKTCCSINLCNAAPGLPGASGLSLALATITALFMANILV